MTDQEQYAVRAILWETASVSGGTLRVELSADHGEASAWRVVAHEVIEAWVHEDAPRLWHRVTAGSRSYLVEGLDPTLEDVRPLQEQLEEITRRVNAEITRRAEAQAREEEARHQAELAAVEHDERLTAAFRSVAAGPGEPRDPEPASTGRRHLRHRPAEASPQRT